MNALMERWVRPAAASCSTGLIWNQAHLARGDVTKSAACTVAFAVIGVAGPNVAGKNTPVLWTKEQTGPHDVEPA